MDGRILRCAKSTFHQVSLPSWSWPTGSPVLERKPRASRRRATPCPAGGQELPGPAGGQLQLRQHGGGPGDVHECWDPLHHINMPAWHAGDQHAAQHGGEQYQDGFEGLASE